MGKNLKDNREDEVYLLNRYILEGAPGSSGVGYSILQRFAGDGSKRTGYWFLDKPSKPDRHLFLAIDSQNHIAADLTESLELFTGIDNLPVWKGTGEVAIAMTVGDQILRGEYMVYRHVQEKKIKSTDQTFTPANLSKTVFYLR